MNELCYIPACLLFLQLLGNQNVSKPEYHLLYGTVAFKLKQGYEGKAVDAITRILPQKRRQNGWLKLIEDDEEN